MDDLDVLWQVNPAGHAALQRAGAAGVVLVEAVCFICAVTARGLWLRMRWGRSLALAMLGLNLVGDLVNSLLLADRRALIGIPIAGAMIVFLLTPGVRAIFPSESWERPAAATR